MVPNAGRIFFLTISYMWSNIVPFGFVNMPKFYIFDNVEIILALLSYARSDAQETAEESESMKDYPWILYRSF